jgi:3-hydroxybutyryl-CoA dehydrogenase
MMAQATPSLTVGLCGIGQMGTSAAVCFRRAGYHILLWARDRRKAASVPERLDALDRWMDEHVGPTTTPGGRVEIVDDHDALDAAADVVMECIAEDMEQKVDLLQRFPAAIARGALLLTVTSGLSITKMARRSRSRHLLAGAHFWNPAHLMPVVEVVRGEETSESTMDRACDLVRSVGKTPIRVERDVPGFIGNRLLHAIWREAISLVARGVATPHDVDLIARLTFGLRLPALGPLEHMDLVGLDLVRQIHDYLLKDLADDREPSRLIAGMIGEGRLGMKSGRGFFDWRERDPEELIERRDLQIVRQLEFLKEQDRP